MATGDRLTSAKAVWGAAVGFLAPGAGFVFWSLTDGSNGSSVVTGSEWLAALCLCVVSAGSVGAVVHRVENKPKL